MMYLVICGVALLASCLTFFSGFGLGTLLLPAFALFFPIEQAIALTAVVHMLNGLFKLGLVGRNAKAGVVLRFGVPAFLASFVGALVLTQLADLPPVASYVIAGRTLEIIPVKLVVELLPRLRDLAFPASLMPLGGLVSGFFGGLAGMQGALRSAFLIRAGLSKEAFIGTGVVVAVLIDLSRLGVYGKALTGVRDQLNYPLLAAAALSAFLGAWMGNRYLTKMTMPTLHRFVAASLFVVAAALVAGIL